MTPPATVEDVAVHGLTDTIGVTIPNPLTCEDVPNRRAKAGKLNGGVAAATNSEFFKAPAPHKPLAIRLDHRMSQEAKLRKSTVLKSLAKHMATPGMISLGGGLPSSEYFPFESMDIKVPAVGKFLEEETKTTGKTMHLGKHDVKEGKSCASGSAQMVRWVTEHTEIVHNPPYRDWACTLSAGSTSSLEMVYRMFLEKGDFVISEEPRTAGLQFVGVKMDSEGMIAEALDELLENWDVATRGARKPFLLYTVPTGQNPTGSTQGRERRQQIYKVAQKHDLILIEDEPYYFLQMQPYTGPGAEPAPLPKNHDEFLKSLVPSLLSMDVDGRVIRLDSFSKVLAPGSRCGWVVASAQVCERLQRHGEVSTQHAAGFSQVILHRLLDEEWGHGGYLDWLVNLRVQYTTRRDALMKACDDHLPKEVATWTPPAAGMFHWINLDVSKHPEFGKKSVAEIEQAVFRTSVASGVLVTPGSYFMADQENELEKVFFRATFAAAEFDTMSEAIRRFGLAIRKVFGLPQ
ncbi:pyridoxal phosphate-dependent transferase [Sphaerosporella brunnea]|uniref:aromatic-amino-acid transaminase n=1 Tax=Sphaerosporella brunnea TaxID=1250544 RepID=A0A5J5EW61_9PEZI|nr:pyridoxal phosphate-dependent transferase [Sphaerosporella brunnea]